MLLEGKKLPDDAMGQAREMYEIVNGMMKYSKVWHRVGPG